MKKGVSFSNKINHTESSLLSEWDTSSLSVILNHLDFAIIITDNPVGSPFINHQGIKLFNFSKENPPQADKDSLMNQIAQCFKNPDSFTEWIYNIISSASSGFLAETQKEIILECKYIPLFEQEVFSGNMWQFIDVTHQKKHENEIREARIKAENSVKSKEAFLANMSHEIRTPMNAIIGMAGLLEKTRLNGKQKSYLEAIQISSEHLLAIINDILDMSKIEAGKLTLENIGFDFQKVVTDSIQSLSYLAASKSVSLNYTIDPAIDKILIGDPVRLEQIFLNLISNAIKFTNEGFVEVNCTLISQNEGINCVDCSISDTGIGIDKDKLSIIFESFSQEDTSTTRRFGGTGLGLSITKQLVERMNGSIRVESEKDKGTTFCFRISFPAGSLKDIPEKSTLKPEYMSLGGVRVLMVEDNKWNQILATAILENWQMEVHIAQNGYEAINMLSATSYDIVIMDIQMPKMGGIEAARVIREELKSNIPIIALTANAIKGDKERFLDAGMNAYLTKPFNENLLFTTLSELLGNPDTQLKLKEEKRLVERNTIPSKELTVSMLAKPLYSLIKLKEHAHGNERFVRKMLRLFIEQTPEAIHEMAENAKSGNFSRIRAISHQIKPSIDLLSIEQMQTEIRLIEKYAESQININEITALIEKTKQVIRLVVAELETELGKEALL